MENEIDNDENEIDNDEINCDTCPVKNICIHPCTDDGFEPLHD